MKIFLSISVAMLIWGNPVFASAPIAGSAEDLKNISSWTARLNRNYPMLDLSVVVHLNSDHNRSVVLYELKALDADLTGKLIVGPGELQTLACFRPECGGGGSK